MQRRAARRNDSASLFCSRCTAPLAIASLADFTDDDQRACLAALFSTLAYGLRNASADVLAIADSDLWRGYLSAFWLRPETALILYAEALAIRSVALRRRRTVARSGMRRWHSRRALFELAIR